jgi:hypothetical protein
MSYHAARPGGRKVSPGDPIQNLDLERMRAELGDLPGVEQLFASQSRQITGKESASRLQEAVAFSSVFQVGGDITIVYPLRIVRK